MTDSMYLLDEYVNVKAGDPIRLFPFGKLVKGGKAREITADLASKFRLPHFKPPIKLGSHDDETPSGGNLTRLEVRADGLYGYPEYTDKGAKALEEGDYRYHSPEVIWEGGLEDPTSGEIIEGPLIAGLALLHTPHLGEQAALYTVEQTNTQGGKPMSETVEVPKGLWDKFVAWFDKTAEPKPEPSPEPEVPEIDAEEFEATKLKAEEYKAELEAFKAEQEKKARIDKFAADLKEAELVIEEGAEKLADLDDEQAEWVLTQFKALSNQADTSELFAEKGTTGESLPENPVEKLHALVQAKAQEAGIDYNAAFKLIQIEQPELFKGGK